MQNEMIAIARSENSSPSTSTVFGIGCTAMVNREDEVCLDFTNCARCKNALVIIDDPLYVARIIKSLSHLEKMELDSRLHTDLIVRFESVFRYTLEILRNEILPQVPKPVLEKARRLALSMPELPRMY
ncbi:hypothetical protein D3C80_1616360 [compost metagenome]